MNTIVHFRGNLYLRTILDPLVLIPILQRNLTLLRTVFKTIDFIGF